MAKYNSGFAMEHKMGLIEVNMPSQPVYLVKYWQYDTATSKWKLNPTKNTDAANTTSASGATDFSNSTWKPWVNTTTTCYLIGKPDAGYLPISANRGTSDSYYSWEVNDKEISYANSFVTTNLSPSDVYLKQAWEFSYTGTGQTFTIPAAGTYCFECWGAQGGDATRIYNYGPDTYGGKGGYSMGTFDFPNTPTLYIYVGQQGGTDNTSTTSTFGGGGGGNGSSTVGNTGTRGGGATDIRLLSASGADGWSGSNSLKTRIVIAGGGGGTSNWSTNTNKAEIEGNANGGGGGGVNGCSGHISYRNNTYSNVSSKGVGTYGATQTTGGSNGSWDGSAFSNPASISGSYGQGGQSSSSYSGGGGGGHYGGATGAAINAMLNSASGGSGFVSGASGCVAISGYRDNSDNSQVRYNNVSYKCTTSSLINGENPLPNSSGLYKETYENSDKETGHSGHGFARITQNSMN